MIAANSIRFLETLPPFLQENKKNIRHIKKAVLFSLGASQIIGAVAAVSAVVALVGNSVLALATLPVGNRDRVINHLNSAKENVKQLVASVISVIPVVGVLSSGLFLAAIGDLQNTTPAFFSKLTETYSCNVLGRLPFAKFGLRQAMFPLRNKEREERSHFEALAQIHREIGVQECSVSVDRKDGRKHNLKAHFINTNDQISAKTMILFHGNGMTGDEMVHAASFYKFYGWNVVMMTFGGYPGCDEAVKTTEASTIQDVHVVLRHLEAQGVETIGVHGLSKGGSVAMHATQLSNRVRFVALEMTYTTAADVAGNLIKNLRLRLPIAKYLPVACAKGVTRAALKAGERVLGVKDKDGNTYYTDGYDNVKKAKQYKGVFVTLGGNCDFLMGRNLHNDLFLENFATDLYRAHVEANPEASGKTAFTKIENAQHCGLLLNDCAEVLQNALLQVK